MDGSPYPASIDKQLGVVGKILTDAGLLTRDKRGKWAYYAVVPQALDTLGEVLRVEHQASGPASCC